jgi:hypothetical protein
MAVPVKQEYLTHEKQVFFSLLHFVLFPTEFLEENISKNSYIFLCMVHQILYVLSLFSAQ